MTQDCSEVTTPDDGGKRPWPSALIPIVLLVRRRSGLNIRSMTTAVLQSIGRNLMPESAYGDGRARLPRDGGFRA
jgi:hypothetical protein